MMLHYITLLIVMLWETYNNRGAVRIKVYLDDTAQRGTISDPWVYGGNFSPVTQR